MSDSKIHILMLNGPPHCGKDTLGEELMTRYTRPDMEIVPFEIKHQLRAIALEAAGLTRLDYEYAKDRVIPAFGVTLRQFMIDCSEKFVIPTYGNNTWIRHTIQQIKTYPFSERLLVVITDLGFERETLALVEAFGLENLTMLQLTRPGCDFGKDSRDYVQHPGIRTYQYNNHDTIDTMVNWTREMLKDQGLPIA